MVVAAAVVGLAVPRAAADCAEARALAKRGDLTRARLLVDACPDDDVARAAIAKALEARRYSPIEIVTKPAGVAVAIDARPDVAIKGGDEVWLPAGTYTFTAGGMATTIAVKQGAHAVVLLEVPGAAPSPRNGAIDFSDEGGGSVVNGPPPKIVHPSLLPDRYQRALASSGSTDSGLDDSDPRVSDGTPIDPARPRFGLVVGLAGVATGFDVHAYARTRTAGGWALVGEAGWDRRSAVQMGTRASFDQLVVPVLGSRRLIEGTIAIDAIAGAQLEVRLDDRVGGASLGRLGGSAIGGFDVEVLDRLPLHGEVLVEYGLGSVGDAGHLVAVVAHVGVVFP